MKKLLTLIMILALLSACSKNSEEVNTNFDSQKVVIKITKKQELAEGLAFYLSLRNDNKLPIAQNNVFISFPIKLPTGVINNPLKVMATQNKLNIKTNEEIQLYAFIPKKSIENNKSLDIEHPEVSIIGYINEVKEENHFEVNNPL